MDRRLKRINYTRIFTYLFMICLVSFTALPIVYLVVSAFKPLDELFIFPPRFYVKNPTLNNFTELLSAMDGLSVPFLRYFTNSLFVTIVSVVAAIFVCSLAAYSMTKMKLPFSNVLFNIVVMALMFSPPVTQLINYLTICRLHLINTYWALIFPKIGIAYYLFLLKQSYSDIPNEILEAAKIDGCGHFRIYLKMVLPLTRPVIATVAVFAFVASWNDYYSALIYINKQSMKTLPLALQMLQGGAGQVARQGAFAAAALITTAPTILLFLIMQSKVVKTMAHTGIK